MVQIVDTGVMPKALSFEERVGVRLNTFPVIPLILAFSPRRR